MRVVAVQLPHRECATVQLWFHAGFSDDPPDARGLTAAGMHALNVRTWIEKREAFPVYSLASQDVCAAVWAGPLNTLSDQIDSAKAMLAACSMELPKRSDLYALATPVEILLAEGIDRFGEPRGRVAELVLSAQLWRAAFAPMADGVIPPTWREEPQWRDRVQRQIALAFSPAAATLTITSAEAPEGALQRAADVLRSLPAAAKKPRIWRGRPTFRAGTLPPRLAAVDGLAIAWPTPRFANVELATFDVLSQYLMNEVDGALRFADTGRKSSSLRAFAADTGLFVLILPNVSVPSFPPSHIAPWMHPSYGWLATRAVYSALANLASEPPDLARLHRAKALAQASERTRRCDPLLEALDYGYAEVLGGDVHLADFEGATIGEVSAAELQSLARAMSRTPPLVQPLLRNPVPRISAVCEENARSPSPIAGCADPSQTIAPLSEIGARYSLRRGDRFAKLQAQCSDRAQAVLRIEFCTALADADTARLSDYATFHGCLIDPASERAAMLILRAPPDRITALIELAFELHSCSSAVARSLEFHLQAPIPADNLLAELRAIGINATAADR